MTGIEDPIEDHTDDRARAAARRFQDHVADSVDLDLAYESVRGEPARRRSSLVVAALAVVALVAGAFVFSPDAGDVEVAVDEEEPEQDEPIPTTVPRPEVVAPNPIALGAPDDGKDSIGLPVAAEPSTGLVSGQSVKVTGSGFPPHESIGVVMCAREAGADQGGRGVDACNIGHFGQGTSDQDGNVTIHFNVNRLVILDGQEIDCASEPGRCILGMGMISDYDQSGGVAVDFDPSAPLPAPPTVELAETTDIADGEVVGATISGLHPETHFAVEQCSDDGTFRCTMISDHVADADGNFDGGLRLWRNFGGWVEPTSGVSPNVDCAVDACTLRIQADVPGGRQIPQVRIAFDPNRGGRTAPTVELAEPGPYREGDEMELRLDGVEDGAYLDIMACTPVPESVGCIPMGGGEYDGSGRFTVTVSLGGMPVDDPCAGGCALLVSTYAMHAGPDWAAGTPPALFPEPIPITITG